MSGTWTLRDADGTEQALADWGLSEVKRERVNQAADVVTFRATGAASDGDPLFAYRSTIELFRNGVRWFYGRITAVPAGATAQGEEQLYRVAGPWWWLENLVFQQTWLTTDGIDATLIATNRSRLILGQAADGTKLATGAAMAEVLAYAIARGAPIAVGTISPNAIAPYAEGLDLSCAQVLRVLCRWTPDAIAAFDYTTTPFPTLSIVQRATASSVTLPAYGAPISGLEITPRYDLLAPSVVLKFEQTNDIDNDTFTTLTVQPAPSTATGDELGALVMTLDLAGARATYQKQNVETAPIPASDTTPGVVAWWQAKFPWLADFAATDLIVVAGSQTITLENPDEYPDLSASDLPNELLQGSITSWMNQQAAPLKVSATLQYIGADTVESTDVFGPKKQRYLYTRVRGTDAETQVYSRLTSETEAEPVPMGLAQALLDSVGTLQYDGSVELTEEECSGATGPGDLVNLSGGRTEWATMAAQVQRVEEELDAGRTRVTFGPAKHLGHADLARLLRVNRERRISYRIAERTSGKASGNAAQVEGGDSLPRSDSVFRPSSVGAANGPFQLLDASDAGGLKVSVNANSFLLESPSPTDTVAITGLASALAAPVGTQVWLEVDFNEDMEATGASIGSGTGGWGGYPSPFVYSGSSPDQVQTTAFVLLGYIAAADDTRDGTVISGGTTDAPVSGKIIQCVTQPLLLRNGNFNGLPAVMPSPYFEPGASS